MSRPALPARAFDGLSTVQPGSTIEKDPRRPGHLMLAVTCWCGRFYTMTLTEALRHYLGGTWPCPDRDCGRGSA